jgi:anti-anti-sigma factor
MAMADESMNGVSWRLRQEPFGVAFGGTRTLVLRGELDMATADELETVIVSCVQSVSGLTLDLSQLTFMDSTGVKLILLTQDMCRVRRIGFRLTPGPRQVQRVFEIAGLVEYLPFREPTT